MNLNKNYPTRGIIFKEKFENFILNNYQLL